MVTTIMVISKRLDEWIRKKIKNNNKIYIGDYDCQNGENIEQIKLVKGNLVVCTELKLAVPEHDGYAFGHCMP